MPTTTAMCKRADEYDDSSISLSAEPPIAIAILQLKQLAAPLSSSLLHPPSNIILNLGLSSPVLPPRSSLRSRRSLLFLNLLPEWGMFLRSTDEIRLRRGGGGGTSSVQFKDAESCWAIGTSSVNALRFLQESTQFHHQLLGSSSSSSSISSACNNNIKKKSQACNENFTGEVFETGTSSVSVVEGRSWQEKNNIGFGGEPVAHCDLTGNRVVKDSEPRCVLGVHPSSQKKLLESHFASISRDHGLINATVWSIVCLGKVIRDRLRWQVVSAAAGDDDGQNVTINYVSKVSNKPRLITNGKDSQQQSTTPSTSSPVQVSPASGINTEAELFLQDNSKMKEEKQLEFILKSLVAGGVAGMCAKTSVAPLDRMKILLQAHSKHYSHLGVFSGLQGIVKKERFIALYKGNGAQMVRIFPYAATQFTSFEMYKKFLGEDSHVARFAAGSAAGVTAVALTYPLDTIRARLAFQVTGEHVYSGIYSCALHIFREEGGIRALYRGFIPTVCGMIPYAGLSFYCFESFKYICMKYFPMYTCKTHSTNTGGLVLLLYAKLLCGGVAGAAAQTVAYPLDVTRRRMQLAMMDEKTKKFGMGMVSTLKLIYQENGVMRGLYRGMSINYLRAIPMVAVSFSTYELVKQMLNLDTGLAIKTG